MTETIDRPATSPILVPGSDGDGRPALVDTIVRKRPTRRFR